MNATVLDDARQSKEVDFNTLLADLSIQRPPPSPAYKFALAATAGAMIALPCAYLALVGFIAWWVYNHATGGLRIVFEYGAAGPLLYLFPLFSGITLLIFLVKPFFARPSHAVPALELQRDREPRLFECVHALCRILEAPLPTRLMVDCEANASASFNKGLLGLVRRDLSLTIGLTLVAGLNVSQFAGVLAHELGHLRQRWGMILTCVVRWVNGWLFRCVYVRDSWDDWLLVRSRERTWRRVFYLLDRGVVWGCRRLLWLLMWLGHLISCYMLRQMEREADELQVTIVGPDGFEQTSLCLIDLNAAVPLAAEGLDLGWRQDRLPDDLPTYINRKILSESRRQEARKAALAEKTGLFDTHPAWRDRLDAARACAAPARVPSPAPASTLFSDFETLSKDVTRFHYRAIMGLDFGSRNLIHVDRAISQEQADLKNWDAVTSLFRGTASALRPFVLQLQDLVASRPPADLIRWMISARMRLQMTNIAAESAYRRFIDAETRIIDAKVANLLFHMGFAIHPAQFGLPAADPVIFEAAERRANDAKREADHELNLFDADVRTRVASAFQLLQIGSFRSRLAGGEKLPAEIQLLARTLLVFKQTAGLLNELRYDTVCLDLLIANRLLTPYREEARTKIALFDGRVRSSLSTLRALLRDNRDPLSSDGATSIASHLWQDLVTAPKEPSAICEEAAIVINRSWHLYYRVLGRIAEITSQIDREAQFVMAAKS